MDLIDVSLSDCRVFVPNLSTVKVVKVYDGDTVTVAGQIRAMDGFYKFSVRLRGIDCPEIRPKKVGNWKDEKIAALEVRDCLAKKINGLLVELRNVEYDKYGRLLAHVYLDDECISDWLVANRMAVEYNGGTKKSPKNWLTYMHPSGNRIIRLLNMVKV